VEFVGSHGLGTAYERAGVGPLLVLVHGAAEDGRTWRLQLADLADDFTVVAGDEHGPGRSCDLPEGMTLAGFADRLAALIESLRLEPAHVAGLSLGGTIALQLYRRHPALVATLNVAQRNDTAGFLSARSARGPSTHWPPCRRTSMLTTWQRRWTTQGSSTSAEPSTCRPTARPSRQDFRAPAEAASKHPSH
jgi:pimeloyl-ACP methyl ester carboxylesterase